jgi:hypothetical protein
MHLLGGTLKKRCTRDHRGSCGARFAVAAVMSITVAVVLLLMYSQAASATARGIVDVRLETLRDVELSIVSDCCDEIGPQGLRARWTRVLIHWAKLQPQAPGVKWDGDADGDGYQDRYVAELEAVIDELHSRGIVVIVTPTEVPKWASDRHLWSSPPFPGMPTGYDPIYAMHMDDPVVRAEFSRLGSFLAQRFGDGVRHLECWNEPNLGGSLYPQARPGDATFGRRVYVRMLRAFHRGVAAVAPSAVVIAGATAPRGGNDHFSTTPQAFAAYLVHKRAGRYFDAYSHHVYPWGRPDLPPQNPRTAVTLGNLDVLMRLFPKKLFFVTEFGYSTKAPTLLGQTVTEVQQARYLRQAYSFATRRYPRLVTILWFMVEDLPANPQWGGVSMGLVREDGTRKPSWYAFTGGNRLTLTAPAVVSPDVRFLLSGTLSCREPGFSSSQPVTVQRRITGTRRWMVVATCRTNADGTFSTIASQSRSARYRVVWAGVCESAERVIRNRSLCSSRLRVFFRR